MSRGPVRLAARPSLYVHRAISVSEYPTPPVTGSQSATSPWRRIPNGLSASRIVVVPILAILLVRYKHGSWIPALVFGCAAWTDQLDGFVARTWSLESVFGKLLDPLADKLLIGATIFFLSLSHRLPWFALPLLISRHLLLWLGYTIFPRSSMLSPRQSGKISAFILYVSIALIIVASRTPVWLSCVFWLGVSLAFTDVALDARQILAAQNDRRPRRSARRAAIARGQPAP